jgi:6-phosphogluconolactonase
VKEIQFDVARKVVIGDTASLTLDYAADLWVLAAKQAIEQNGKFLAALSGGSTPKEIYKRLAQKKEALDWSKVWLFFSDERAVPLDHIESNYRMAMESGFHELPIPREQIFPMKGEGDLEKNALDYELCLKSHLGSKGFDLMMLGMGEDGHTASLFPKTHALHASARLVVANFLPEKSIWRLTCTYECINDSKRINVYALGAGKAPMIKKVFLGPQIPDDLPIQKVGTETHPALFILDQAAALDTFNGSS